MEWFWRKIFFGQNIRHYQHNVYQEQSSKNTITQIIKKKNSIHCRCKVMDPLFIHHHTFTWNIELSISRLEKLSYRKHLFCIQYKDWTLTLNVKCNIIRMSTTGPLTALNPFQIIFNIFRHISGNISAITKRILIFNHSRFWGFFS